MKSLKEYFKQRLSEDMTEPELTAHMRDLSDIASKAGNPRIADRIDREREEMEKSPHLYRRNPTTGEPEEVEGVKISPSLHAAIDAAVRINYPEGKHLSPRHIKQLRSFVALHGDVVGRTPGTPWQFGPDSLQWSTSRGLDDSDMIHRTIDPVSRRLGRRVGDASRIHRSEF